MAALRGEKGSLVGARRELWVVDEAGMLSTRQAAAILERARETGAKVVLLGDSRQHAAVEAGRPFRYLADAGLDVARLDQIRRQRDEVLRQAVRDASEGRTRQAVARLDEAGHVIEVKDPLDRHRAIAEEASKHAERRTLVVAPSNEERQQINRLVRERLIAEGRVGKESIKVSIAIDKGLTQPELRLARSYETGDHTRFTRGLRKHRIEAGAEARVVAADVKTNRVTIDLRDGRRIEYDPRDARGTSVAKVEDRRLAVGDRVQFRAPDRGNGIANGQLGTVRELEAARATVEVDGGRCVALDPGRPQPIDYGYASTSHAAQGQSVDRVIVCIDTERSAALVNQQQFYVSISRARESAVVFTDSRRDLVRAVSRQAETVSALDYVGTSANGKERGDGSRPEPGREAGRGDASRLAGADGRSRGQELDRDGRTVAGAPDAGPQAGRDREAAGRGTGAGDAPGLREPGEALGRDGGPLPDARGRARTPGGERFHPGPPWIAAGVLQRHDGRFRPGRDADDLGAPALATGSAVGGARDRAARDSEAGPASGSGGSDQARAPETALTVRQRMQIRDEEHHALQGILPPDLAARAIRLNVASREGGGGRVVTAARVGQLGVEGIRRVVSMPDPKQAALAIARAVVSRVIDRGTERER